MQVEFRHPRTHVWTTVKSHYPADGRHAQFLGALDQIRYFRCAVEQRIMRVIMQLHAMQLEFRHPRTHVWTTVKSHYPADQQHALDVMRARHADQSL